MTEERSAEHESHESAASPLAQAWDPTVLTRGDLLALSAVHRRAVRRWPLAALVFSAFGGLAGGALVHANGLAWGWSTGWTTTAQAVGWLVAIGASAIAVRRNRHQRSENGVACTHCRHFLAPTELIAVVTTGRCPACGTLLLPVDD